MGTLPGRYSVHKAKFSLLFFAAVVCLLSRATILSAREKDHPPYFLPDERRIILEFFRDPPSGGLPPGLAKRGGNLPPGLQKHLQKNGTLLPGLPQLDPLIMITP